MIYTCEIINDNVPYSEIQRPPTNCKYQFFAKITSIKYGNRNLPKEFETIILFYPLVCEAYDKETHTYPFLMAIPLEMICAKDYIEFKGIPYKNRKPIDPSYPENADWIAIDPSVHIKRLSPDLKSARKLVESLEEEKEKEILAKYKTILNWPYKHIKSMLRWTKPYLKSIIVSVVAILVATVIIYLVKKFFEK